MFPKVAIDGYVPASVISDVRATISNLLSKGASKLLINVPLEDLCNVMQDLAPRVGMPFHPVLCGVAVQGWPQSFISVMATENSKEVSLFDVSGKRHDLNLLNNV